MSRYHQKSRVTDAKHGDLDSNLWKFMRRHRLMLLGLLLTSMLFARVGCYALVPSSGNLMEDKYLRIHDGMTIKEVEAFLGKANFTDDPDLKTWSGLWTGLDGHKGGFITIHFLDGKVTKKSFHRIEVPDRPHFPRGY